MLIFGPIEDKDKPFVTQVLKNLWGSSQIVYSGRVFEGSILPGFIAKEENRAVGLLTYFVEKDYLQIISINALTPGRGIGTALIEEVKKVAKGKELHRITVITTNDNLEALSFYEGRGFVVKKIHKGAVALSRAIKPAIPLLGEHGIPLEDEIELELSMKK